MPDDVTQPTPTLASDWRAYLNDDLKADPVVLSWSEQASEKDVPAILKGYAHAMKRMGRSVTLPGKDAKPEEVEALRAKLYDAGVFPRPPADPKDYGIAKPGQLPDGVVWDDELAAKFAATLHKHGAKKELAGELLSLYEEAIGNAEAVFKTNADEAMAKLKAEHGDKFDERWDAARRIIHTIFTPQEVETYNRLGLGDHPGLMSALLKLAPLAMQDSSFLRDIPQQGGELSLDDAREKARDIMSNPKNPLYEKWIAGDPEALRAVDELYRKAVGNAPVVIGG